MTQKQKKLLWRILAAAVLFVPLYLISEGIVHWAVPRWALLMLFLVPYLLVGYDILRKAFQGIRNGSVFDENFLMTVATIGAIALGEYGEGVAVMLLYQVGELFQSYAVGKSRRNISALMDIRPDYANIEEDGELTRVDPDEVTVGTVIVVQPGEKVPIDGVVEEGTSSLDTAALTGESLPVTVGPGREVLSGSINLSGLLHIRTTREFDESTASRILELVENAASRKAVSENFISRFAHYYTPIVCYAALALAVLPPLFCTLTGIGMAGYASLGALWGDWVLRACTFLVISCPCAVVISIPLSFFAALGGASSQGILIKGSNFLESLSRVTAVAFDKTGTITKGNFAVETVHNSPWEREKVLEIAAHVECHSTHPIARSIREAYGGHVESGRVTDVEEISGHGVVARLDGVTAAVGNEKLMQRLGVTFSPCHHVGTVIHVAYDGTYGGHIVIADQVKESAPQAVSQVRRSGVKRLVMLTGDSASVAEKVAHQVGIREYRAGLLPADKVDCVEQLLAENGRGDRLAFVGDGINDAPVLARADVGIAMGALGSDAAIEAADVVLMDDKPSKIAQAVRIARRTLRIARENIIFAIGIKVLVLVLATFGLATMWMAVFADVGVTVLAVLNAMRALRG